MGEVLAAAAHVQEERERRREILRDKEKATSSPKHGEDDGKEHVGGNRFAGGTGGDGMSLSYGGSLTTREPFTKRRGHIGEEGAGLGVRVLFRTARGGPSIEVWHDGAAIATKPCPDLRSGEPTNQPGTRGKANHADIQAGILKF